MIITSLCLLALVAATPCDEAYIGKFEAAFPRVEKPLPLEEYAMPQRFDELYLREGWDASLTDLHNDSGNIAWGTSYLMMALNGMYEVTDDKKYLEANAKVIARVMEVRDSTRGLQLEDGRSVNAWGSLGYSGGKRAVHAVHSGIIAAPMLQFASLVREEKIEVLASAADAAYDAGIAAIAVHEEQWREGPEENSGHYVGAGFEEGYLDKPLPGNWQSAMGWACLFAWLASGQKEDAQLTRALKLGRYIKNRLTLAEDDAYYWPYQLPDQAVEERGTRESISGEDASHAFLTMALPFELFQQNAAITKAGHDRVFKKEDMKRVAKMFVNSIATRDDGVLYPSVTGDCSLDPASYLAFPSRWLWLSEFEPLIAKRLLAFYKNHRETPAPLELAELLNWRSTQRN